MAKMGRRQTSNWFASVFLLVFFSSSCSASCQSVGRWILYFHLGLISYICLSILGRSHDVNSVSSIATRQVHHFIHFSLFHSIEWHQMINSWLLPVGACWWTVIVCIFRWWNAQQNLVFRTCSRDARWEQTRTFAQNKPDAKRTTSHILRFINIRNRNGRAIKLCSFFIGAFRS